MHITSENNENQANFIVTENGDSYLARLNISGSTILNDGEKDFEVEQFTTTYNNCYVDNFDLYTLESCEERLQATKDFINNNSGKWIVAAPALSQIEVFWPDHRTEIENFYLWGGGTQYYHFCDISGTEETWWQDDAYMNIGEWVLRDRGFHCLQLPDYNDGETRIQVRELMAGYRTIDGKNEWLYRVGNREEPRAIFLRYPLRITTNRDISSLVLPLPRDGKQLGFFAYTINEENLMVPHRGYRMQANTTIGEGRGLQLIQFSSIDDNGEDIGFPQNVLVYPIGSKTNETSYASQQGYTLETNYGTVYPIVRIGFA